MTYTRLYYMGGKASPINKEKCKPCNGWWFLVKTIKKK